MSTNQTEPNTKRRVGGLSLLLAAAPVLLALFLSMIAYFAGFFLSMWNDKIGTGTSTAAATLTPSDEGWVYLIQYLLFIIFFGTWYWYLNTKSTHIHAKIINEEIENGTLPKTRKKRPLPPWNPVKYWGMRLPWLIALGFAIQLAGSAVIMIFSNAFPDTFSAYKELVQSMVGTETDWKTIIAVVLLAPIGEELLFRGVSYTYARHALRPTAAIIFQAVLFGVYHGNLIQFFYGTLIGILFGFLRKQSGSVIPGLVLHVIINSSAYLIPASWLENVPKSALMLLVATAVIIPCCLILLARRKHKKPEGTTSGTKPTTNSNSVSTTKSTSKPTTKSTSKPTSKPTSKQSR